MSPARACGQSTDCQCHANAGPAASSPMPSASASEARRVDFARAFGGAPIRTASPLPTDPRPGQMVATSADFSERLNPARDASTRVRGAAGHLLAILTPHGSTPPTAISSIGMGSSREEAHAVALVLAAAQNTAGPSAGSAAGIPLLSRFLDAHREEIRGNPFALEFVRLAHAEPPRSALEIASLLARAMRTVFGDDHSARLVGGPGSGAGLMKPFDVWMAAGGGAVAGGEMECLPTGAGILPCYPADCLPPRVCWLFPSADVGPPRGDEWKGPMVRPLQCQCLFAPFGPGDPAPAPVPIPVPPTYVPQPEPAPPTGDPPTGPSGNGSRRPGTRPDSWRRPPPPDLPPPPTRGWGWGLAALLAAVVVVAVVLSVGTGGSAAPAAAAAVALVAAAATAPASSNPGQGPRP